MISLIYVGDLLIVSLIGATLGFVATCLFISPIWVVRRFELPRIKLWAAVVLCLFAFLTGHLLTSLVEARVSPGLFFTQDDTYPSSVYQDPLVPADRELRHKLVSQELRNRWLYLPIWADRCFSDSRGICTLADIIQTEFRSGFKFPLGDFSLIIGVIAGITSLGLASGINRIRNRKTRSK